MQDDSKFLDSNSQEPDQEKQKQENQNEERPKKIIELPDLDLPSKSPDFTAGVLSEDETIQKPEEKKKLDPEYLSTVRKEDKKTPFDNVKPEKKDTEPTNGIIDKKIFQKPKSVTTGKNLLLFLPWIYIGPIIALSILLFISTLTNISSVKDISEIKTKALSNAQLATQMVNEKEKVKEEQKTLESDVARLKKELSSAQSISAGLQKQNENLKAEVIETKAKFDELREKVKGYASEVKDLVSTRIKYYDAYSEEKENKQKLAAVTKKMETEIKNLNAELNSISKQYSNQESEYAYEMAFVYTKALMYDEAIESFRRYLELGNDKDADVYYNLALIYEQAKKESAEAISYYRKYLELNPSAEDLYEIKMRISSLERTGSESKYFFPTQKKLEIDLEKFKY